MLEIPLNQGMGFHFTQVITELGERIGRGLETKGFEKSLMEITSSPRGDTGAGMNEHFHEADQAGIVDFNSWDFGMAGDDGESQTLEQREIDVDLKGFRLKGGEAVDNGQEFGAYGCQMLDSLFEEEVLQVIATDLDSQEGLKFFILFDKGMFEVGAQDMVAMVDPFEGGMELSLKMPGGALAEDLRDLFRGQFKETEFAGAFEEFVDGKGFAKDKIQTILHLAEGIETAEIDGLTFSFGELGTQKKGPIVETLLQQFGGKTVGSLLEGFGVINGQKGIILFSERDASPVQFGFQKMVTVNIVGGLERKKRADSQDHGTQLGISKVEVVMGKAASGFA